MSQETLTAQIEERRRQAEETLAQFEAIEQQIRDNDSFFFPYLTLKSGLANTRARLRWAEEALEELNERRPSTPPSE